MRAADAGTYWPSRQKEAALRCKSDGSCCDERDGRLPAPAVISDTCEPPRGGVDQGSDDDQPGNVRRVEVEGQRRPDHRKSDRPLRWGDDEPEGHERYRHGRAPQVEVFVELVEGRHAE